MPSTTNNLATEPAEVPDSALEPNGKSSTSSYELREEPIHSRRPLRVVCLGAGYSGILMGIIWSQRMQNRDAELVLYERNTDLGGTWLENRYPGCQCDIPAHNYAYSFEPNLEWPNYYATSKQIHDYLKKTAAKYDVERYIQYKHAVESARWDDVQGKWSLTVRNGDHVFETQCDVFVNAGGVLNNWNWPDVEGLDSYQGKLVHSAAWDESYDYSGKRIAVIGNGSSAIQIIPQLAKGASHLTSFIRSHAWISPAPGINEPTSDDPATDDHYNYAPEVLERFKTDPEACLSHCRSLIDRRLTNFRRTHAASEVQKAARKLFTNTMRQRLGDTEKGRALADLLIPQFPVGCRRQTPGPGYLEALLQDNVDTRWDDLERFTPHGIQTQDGTTLEFDVIVCATGFDTTFRPRMPIIGRNGEDLTDRWEREPPKSYFGLAVPDLPNYFTFIGPSSPISNGSLVQGIQMMGIYIWKCIDKIQTERIKSLIISREATDDYYEHVQKFLERTVWVGNCRSWYKRGMIDGPVVAIYGGTSFHYIEALRNPRWEDYEVSLLPAPSTNRFAYLGNGFTMREEKNGSVADTQTLGFDAFWKLFVLPELYD
ncbi:flavin-containing monooxygenase [Aspergillus stella-maris]|uniref:flavin-containing monooxygenase n=1 Tax=Aspergillus stella-maris TaxID=1810926 RepID=UPI003CCCB685